jgi:hypothetical protein
LTILTGYRLFLHTTLPHWQSLIHETIFGLLSKQISHLKFLNMKRLIFMMVVVNTLTISTLSSCNKNDSLPDSNTNVTTPKPPITLNLTAYRWEKESNEIIVNTFANVIPPSDANRSVKVYLVTNDQETQINQPISFMNGQLWATIIATDVRIHYQGNSPVEYLNIKVVIE